MKPFESTYARPTNPDAVRNLCKTFSFYASKDLTKAIQHATDRGQYRFISEFIRSAIIKEIERQIKEM